MKMKNNQPTCFIYILLTTLVIGLVFSHLVNAESIVKTFTGLASSPSHNYKSDLYKIWVKKLDNITAAYNEIPSNNNFNPFSTYTSSYTYKSVNDVSVGVNDSNSDCIQYYGGDDFDPVFNLESKLEEGPVEYNGVTYQEDCEDTGQEITGNAGAYDLNSHTNNWTSFDIGHDGNSPATPHNNPALGAVRVFIVLDMGIPSSDDGINYEIRPSRYSIDNSKFLNASKEQYIRERFFGTVNVKLYNSNSNYFQRKVLVLDILEPNGTDWSGQFYVKFDGRNIVKSNYKYDYGAGVLDFGLASNSEPLEKHPLFIFANPLPAWYYHSNANKAAYNGCPKNDVGLFKFHTPMGWDPGYVVDASSVSYEGGVTHTIPDLLLKPSGDASGAKKFRICIPGGVYVRGRIIHSSLHHPANSTDGGHTNMLGVRIVGRGILSGAHIKHRNESKLVKKSGQLEKATGSGWYGHLVDIRSSKTDLFDNYSPDGDCYTRTDDKGVNCIQGITLVDAPKAGIYTAGTRMDIENVKNLSWNVETVGFAGGKGSVFKNVFAKVNDDNITMVQSNITIENLTSWRQRWGSVINLGWNLTGAQPTVTNHAIDGINVIRFDPSSIGENKNRNAAIFALRNMRGGTVGDASSSNASTFDNIVVEEAPYEIINLQVDDEITYCSTCDAGIPHINPDGTGTVQNLIFNGLFTPTPYNIDTTTSPKYSGQKSIISTFNESGTPSGTVGIIENIKFRNICVENKAVLEYGGLNSTFIQYDNYFTFTNVATNTSTTPTDIGRNNPAGNFSGNQFKACDNLKTNCTYEQLQTPGICN